MKRKLKRKLDRMHELFGVDGCHTCGQCSNFVSGRYYDRILRKCAVYGLTHSEASDWAKRWTACGMFDREYCGRNVIEIGLSRGKEQEIPLDGQISMLAEKQK